MEDLKGNKERFTIDVNEKVSNLVHEKWRSEIDTIEFFINPILLNSNVPLKFPLRVVTRD